MQEVFISYARDDADRVRHIIQEMQSEGFNIWWDERIDASEAWRRAIEERLNGAGCVAVMWSRKSIRQAFVLAEAEVGRRNGVLLSIMLDTTPPPMPFQEDQAVSLRGWRFGDRGESWERLLDAVSRYVGRPIRRGGEGAFRLDPKRAATPRQIFRDPFIASPVMVVIPSGRFTMGSPAEERGRDECESPQRVIAIERPFALAQRPVTFAEYDAYCESVGLVPPKDEGWGRGERPAIHVSWRDAQAYCAWLSERAEGRYRLPSEAEWEYACRAGAQTPFSCGETIGSAAANFNGARRYRPTDPGGVYRGETSPAGEFRANRFFLSDMHGNVWEWCEDSFSADLRSVPADGAPQTGDPDRRVLRGGSWRNPPEYLRSAKRAGLAPTETGDAIGFRVARDIELTAAPEAAEAARPTSLLQRLLRLFSDSRPRF